MKEAGYNPTSWARAAGASETGVREFLNGTAPNISLAYLEKLAHVLNKQPMDFLPPTVSPEDAVFLSEMRALSDEDREEVRRLIARFARDRNAELTAR
ncbi:helix-turn-helix domain-containing protein [Telmatospirillum sp.]|uniref:helix-turn-helix domain-containing protein n=1 Tax=Telmatospirillum sp. TaxID=2079197 RepID=UPI0038685A3A